jgi:hypothetical protein
MKIQTVIVSACTGVLIGSVYINNVQCNKRIDELNNHWKTAHEQCLSNSVRIYDKFQDRNELLSSILGVDTTDYLAFSLPVRITAYSANEQECDSSPERTASNSLSRVGTVALSPDIRQDLSISYGDKIILYQDNSCLGVFSVEDSTSTYKHKNTNSPKPITRTVDIMMGNRTAAKEFGVQSGKLVLIKERI